LYIRDVKFALLHSYKSQHETPRTLLVAPGNLVGIRTQGHHYKIPDAAYVMKQGQEVLGKAVNLANCTPVGVGESKD